jgi:exopolysaccharide biosynthesis WecB/TagA/CpsF family protein
MDALNPPRVSLLELDFADIALPTALAWLLARPPEALFGYVVTPNADHIQRLRRVPALLPVYQGAMLRLLDSRFLALSAAALGLPTPQVVTGADLVAALLPRLAGQRVAVVGLDEPGMAVLAERYPQISFHHHAPPMKLLTTPEAVRVARDFVVTVGAPFTFLALGSPVQEILAHALSRDPQARGVGLCVGAALDFAALCKRRAPVWMRRAGLEWLHRFAQEPLRLGARYLLADPPVLLALLAEAWQKNP